MSSIRIVFSSLWTAARHPRVWLTAWLMVTLPAVLLVCVQSGLRRGVTFAGSLRTGPEPGYSASSAGRAPPSATVRGARRQRRDKAERRQQALLGLGATADEPFEQHTGQLAHCQWRDKITARHLPPGCHRQILTPPLAPATHGVFIDAQPGTQLSAGLDRQAL